LFININSFCIKTARASITQRHREEQIIIVPAAKDFYFWFIKTACMPAEIKTTASSSPEGIFISYRRDGSSTFSSILYYELCKYFSAETIFKDAVTLKPGTDFKKEIEQALDRSSILVALLDRNWARLKNDKGELRLFQEDDFVCREISVALEKGIEIIPVLFENGQMPQANELPVAIQALCSKQAFTIHVDAAMEDIAELIQYIRSKKRFSFDEKSITGAYERIIKDPIGTIKKGLQDNANIFKKDFNYLRKFIGRHKK
jgi:hypothetical protein